MMSDENPRRAIRSHIRRRKWSGGKCERRRACCSATCSADAPHRSRPGHASITRDRYAFLTQFLYQHPLPLGAKSGTVVHPVTRKSLIVHQTNRCSNGAARRPPSSQRTRVSANNVVVQPHCAVDKRDNLTLFHGHVLPRQPFFSVSISASDNHIPTSKSHCKQSLLTQRQKHHPEKH